MGLLGHSEVLQLRRTAIALGLAGRREVLIRGIHIAFVASIPQVSAPGDQLWADLMAMNDAGMLVDNTMPLEVWLKNAIDLTELHPESSVFANSLARIQRSGRKEDKPPSTKAEMVESPTIGIITALPIELAAMKAMLDDPREIEVPGRGAGRSYWLGELPGKGGTKHLAAVCCVGMGNNQASARATRLLEHFQDVDAIIMVGIAGAVPNHKKPAEHVRLGDVVVSDHRGVVQYDFVKEARADDGDVAVEHRFSPRPPGARLLEADRALQVKELEQQFPWQDLFVRAETLRDNGRPTSADILYHSANPRKKINHPTDPKRRNGFPRVFRGPIASANVLLKDPKKRDMLRDKFGVKAVEMESSGVADATWVHEVGYLVVRGTCDYCDGAKNDDWHAYASIIAATYARELLSNMTPAGTVRYAPQTDVSAQRSAGLSASAHSDGFGAEQSAIATPLAGHRNLPKSDIPIERTVDVFVYTKDLGFSWRPSLASNTTVAELKLKAIDELCAQNSRFDRANFNFRLMLVEEEGKTERRCREHETLGQIAAESSPVVLNLRVRSREFRGE